MVFSSIMILFLDNDSGTMGGAILSYYRNVVTAINCVFSSNLTLDLYHTNFVIGYGVY